MYAFQYRKAASLKEAGELLKKDAEAKPMSGGMTLIPTLKARLADPGKRVSRHSVPELKGVCTDDAGGLCIGAATTHAGPPSFCAAPTASCTVKAAMPRGVGTPN